MEILADTGLTLYEEILQKENVDGKKRTQDESPGHSHLDRMMGQRIHREQSEQTAREIGDKPENYSFTEAKRKSDAFKSSFFFF